MILIYELQNKLRKRYPDKFWLSLSQPKKTINGKIKVIDKDISDFSVDRTKRDWREIKIDWTMTNNLLIEETDELIKGMEIDKSTFYKSYKALPLAIYIEIERLSVSKSALYKSLCAKARIVAESFHRSIK
jgi:hypothetical protein